MFNPVNRYFDSVYSVNQFFSIYFDMILRIISINFDLTLPKLSRKIISWTLDDTSEILSESVYTVILSIHFDGSQKYTFLI